MNVARVTGSAGCGVAVESTVAVGVVEVKEEWKPRAVKVSFHQRRPLTYFRPGGKPFPSRKTLYGSFPRMSRSSS